MVQNGANARFALVSASHATAASELEDAEDDVARMRNRVTAMENVVESSEAEFAGARLSCDLYGSRVVYDDVTWCDLSSSAFERREDAKKDAAQAEVTLGQADETLEGAKASEGALRDSLNEAEADLSRADSIALATLVVSVSLTLIGALFLTAWTVVRIRRRNESTSES